MQEWGLKLLTVSGEIHRVMGLYGGAIYVSDGVTRSWKSLFQIESGSLKLYNIVLSSNGLPIGVERERVS